MVNRFSIIPALPITANVGCRDQTKEAVASLDTVLMAEKKGAQSHGFRVINPRSV